MRGDVGKLFPQYIIWRRPATSKKHRGKYEIVMTTVHLPSGVQLDIRHKKNDGGTFTKEGVRLTVENANSLHKALGKILQEIEREEDATSGSGETI